MKRTKHGWESSGIGRAAMYANLELKKVFSVARSSGVNVTAESFRDCWDGGVAAYFNARDAWLAGDDANAAQFVAYAGMCAGMATRDKDEWQREMHSQAGLKGRGRKRPNRRSPVVDALRVLAAEGMNNDEVLAALGDADAICSRVRDGFPIEVCEPETNLKDDGVMHWYLPGGDSDKPEEYKVSTLLKRLSEIRKGIRKSG